ncbi:hypothetical protein [Rhizobium sp. LEGMi135b]
MGFHRHTPHADRILDSSRGLGYTRPRFNEPGSTLGSCRKTVPQGEELISWIGDKGIKYNPDFVNRAGKQNGESRYIFGIAALLTRCLRQFSAITRSATRQMELS